MTIRTSPWPAGVPCWADLMAPDVSAARAFYSAVLGWSFEDPAEEFGGYVVATAKGAPAAGIGPEREGARTAWTLYIASDDADATAASITEHGGTVIAPPGEVGSLGRMLIAADPTGAAFGVWQARTYIGSGIVNEPGGITWEDLRTADPDAARAFYTAVFGYRTDAIEMAPPDYTTFALAGEEAPLGGIGGMMGAAGPPHWLVYFAVADTAVAVAAAESGGGTVVMPTTDTPFGKMAGLADPAGALFWVVESQPDRSG